MIERGMDQFEVASELEEMERLRGREAVAKALRPKPEEIEGFDGCHCIDCEDALPPVRLAYGWVRCAPCQAVIERQLKRLGRR